MFLSRLNCIRVYFKYLLVNILLYEFYEKQIYNNDKLFYSINILYDGYFKKIENFLKIKYKFNK